MDELWLQYIYLAVIAAFAAGAVLSLILYKTQKLSNYVSNSVSILASVLGITLSVLKLSIFNGYTLKYETSTNIPLIPLKISVAVDNLSAFFILIISFVSLIVSIYSYGYLKSYYNKHNTGYFGFLQNSFILSMILVVTAGQFFFFLIVWEIMSLVSFFLVIFEGGKKEQKAGNTYIIMTHMGTAFIIAAFALLYKYGGSADFALINAAAIPVNIKNFIFVFTLAGFGTKAGIIPLHVWLPSAHPAAPGNISALMSGVMIKTAVYGIVRIVLGILGGQYLWWGTVILFLGVASTILGIAYALMEVNIKRLLAYSSVENIGIIITGIGLSIIGKASGNNVLAAMAFIAAMVHLFNHSIFKVLMFLGAGAVHFSTKTKDMEKLGGLIKKMPYTAVFFLTGSLAISSIPPFNGFVGEWILYQSMFLGINSVNSVISIILILSTALIAMAGVLAAYSFVKAFGIAFLALPRTSLAAEAKEVPKPMLLGMAVLSVMCTVTGLFPQPVIRLIDVLSADVMGLKAYDSLKGVWCFIYYPVEVKGTNISLLAVVIFGALFISASVPAVILLKKKAGTRVYGTWDCGYVKLTPKMQYTATGFSKPLRIVFRGILRPQRELFVEEGSQPYHIKSARYVVSTQSIIEKYLYKPIIENIINFARRTRLLIQTGSIHTYLIYIFIVIILMLVYYAVS